MPESNEAVVKPLGRGHRAVLSPALLQLDLMLLDEGATIHEGIYVCWMMTEVWRRWWVWVWPWEWEWE